MVDAAQSGAELELDKRLACSFRGFVAGFVFRDADVLRRSDSAVPGPRGAGAPTRDFGGYDSRLVGSIYFIISDLLPILDSCPWVRFSVDWQFQRFLSRWRYHSDCARFIGSFKSLFLGSLFLSGERNRRGGQDFEQLFDVVIRGNFGHKFFI